MTPFAKPVKKSHDPVVKPGEKTDPVCVPPDPVFQLILGTLLRDAIISDGLSFENSRNHWLLSKWTQSSTEPPEMISCIIKNSIEIPYLRMKFKDKVEIVHCRGYLYKSIYPSQSPRGIAGDCYHKNCDNILAHWHVFRIKNTLQRYNQWFS